MTPITQEETPNPMGNSEEVKKGSKGLRKYIIIGATVATALAAAFGITEYLKNSKNEILSPEDINRPTETEITTGTSGALVDNLKDTDHQSDSEETKNKFSFLNDSTQGKSKTQNLGKYTFTNSKGALCFNDDGEYVAGADEITEILKTTKRDTVNFLSCLKLLTDEMKKALQDNSNITYVETNEGTITKEKFLKELILWEEAAGKVSSI